MVQTTTNHTMNARDTAVHRWLCLCQDPPVLLATYDDAGGVNIKVRDRYWHCTGGVQTMCPKCGQNHVLDRAS